MTTRLCWIESAVNQDDRKQIIEWALEQHHDILNNISEMLCDHITLIYGFQEKYIDLIRELVGNNHTFDVTLIKPCVGHINNKSLIFTINSKEMKDLFFRIRNAIPDCKQDLVDGEYIPHITVCHFKEAPLDCKIKHPFKLYGKKIRVNFFIKVGDE